MASTSQADKPERSRNAKAQARHRAKRKAYIEQLEQTVTKLQTALGFTPEQVAALPPPLARIQELEKENTRLQEENDKLRRLLGEQGAGVPPVRRSNSAYGNGCDARDYGAKRRRLSEEDLVYMPGPSPSDPHHHHQHHHLPPPLTIPQPQQPSHNSHPHYTTPTPNSAAPNGLYTFSSNFNSNTPSGSSTGSPPFSPATTHTTTAPSPITTSGPGIPSWRGGVKVEDDHPYSNHTSTNGNSYTLPPPLPPPPFHPQPSDGWGHGHSYSSERLGVHR